MKYYIIAGEPSGDLHGANLIKGIKKADAQAEFRFWGGDLMSEEAGTPVRHIRETSIMGLTAVLMNLRKVLGFIKLCKKDLLEYKPDVLILIDYAGFNLRMAKFAKKHGVKIFYYIAPKVWAWKESRVHKIRKYVDKLFVIFPFEVDYFKKWGIDAIYLGNPLLDAIAQKSNLEESFDNFISRNGLESKPIVALLAGSRRQEIKYLLPVMLKVAEKFSDYQFVVAGATALDKSVYDGYMEGSDVKLVYGQTYELLVHSKAALVTSGTATLETALLNIPEVVCYISDAVTIFVARLFVKGFISLVNLVMEKEVVVELIQEEVNIKRVSDELSKVLPNGSHREQMLSDYAQLHDKMGDSGASNRVGAEMVKLLNGK